MNAPIARPTRSDVAIANKEIGHLKCEELFRSPKVMDLLRQVVPKHLTVDRMIRVTLQALFKTQKLYECEPMTLLGAVMALGSLGLEPNTPLSHAYLVPFNGRRKNSKTGAWEDYVEVVPIIGYRGFIDLARRSGQMVNIHSDVVYEGDEFSFEYGSNMHLRHVPMGARGIRKKIWAYCHVTLKDGQAFEVLPYAEVLSVRDKTQAYQAALKAKYEAENEKGKGWKIKAYNETPWVAFEHEMAAKTMVRRLAKYLPMSIEMANAVNLDELSDKIDFRTFANNPAALDDVGAAIQYGGDRDGDEGGEESPNSEAKTPAPKARKGKEPARAIDEEAEKEADIMTRREMGDFDDEPIPFSDDSHDPETGEIVTGGDLGSPDDPRADAKRDAQMQGHDDGWRGKRLNADQYQYGDQKNAYRTGYQAGEKQRRSEAVAMK